jgi:hypothetical protein
MRSKKKLNKIARNGEAKILKKVLSYFHTQSLRLILSPFETDVQTIKGPSKMPGDFPVVSERESGAEVEHSVDAKKHQGRQNLKSSISRAVV